MAIGQKTGGRRKGTPNKSAASIKALATPYGHEALETLVSILRNGEAETSRIASAKEILDRAYGKSTQLVGGDEDNPLVYELVLKELE